MPYGAQNFPGAFEVARLTLLLIKCNEDPSGTCKQCSKIKTQEIDILSRLLYDGYNTVRRNVKKLMRSINTKKYAILYNSKYTY